VALILSPSCLRRNILKCDWVIEAENRTIRQKFYAYFVKALFKLIIAVFVFVSGGCVPFPDFV
jgi:hypothetical protein